MILAIRGHGIARRRPHHVQHSRERADRPHDHSHCEVAAAIPLYREVVLAITCEVSREWTLQLPAHVWVTQPENAKSLLLQVGQLRGRNGADGQAGEQNTSPQALHLLGAAARTQDA